MASDQLHCIIQCSFNREHKDEPMIQCCQCMVWYHYECIELDSEEPIGFFSCHRCRETPELIRQISRQLKLLDTSVSRHHDETYKEMTHLQTENEKLRDENKRLKEQVAKLTNDVQRLQWNSFTSARNESQNEGGVILVDDDESNEDKRLPLIIGDSLTRLIDSNDDVDVITIGGAKIKDIKTELEKKKPTDIYLIIGTNNCSESNSDVDKILEDYRELLIVAKTVATGSVSASSIPPRADKSDYNATVTRVNDGLNVLCQEEGCSFIDNDAIYHLRNGKINMGFFTEDKLHLNRLGTIHLLDNLNIDSSLIKSQNTPSPKGSKDNENCAPILFRGHMDPLSNFFPCEIHIYGKYFHSSEAAFQYRKALHHEKYDAAELISGFRNAKRAKDEADQCLPSDVIDQQWLDKRSDVMRQILEVKAKQCLPFRDRLLKTGTRPLIEDTNHPYWARGINGKGQNMLGTLLELLRQKVHNAVPHPQPSGTTGRHKQTSTPRNAPKTQQQINVRIGGRLVNRNVNRTFSTNLHNTPARCYYCWEPGHVQRVCGHGGPVQCRNCYGLGHKSKHCWN